MRSGFSVWLAGALGAAVSLAVFSSVRGWERERLEARFRLVAAERSKAIRNEFVRNADLLRTVAALYAARDAVTRDEFHRFSVQIRDNHEDLISLEWIPRLPLAEKAAFESGIRAQGFPMAPARASPPGREEFFPVEYLYDFTFQPSTIGLDRSALPEYWKVMRLARDEGREISLPAVHTWMDRGIRRSSDVVEVFLPIYRNGLPRETVDDRRRSLTGFVMVSFDVGKTLDEALRWLTPQGVDLRLEDIAVPGGHGKSWFHSSRRTAAETEREPRSRLAWEESWSLLGRVWRIRCVPAPGFFRDYGSADSWQILLLCLLVTFLAVERLLFTHRRTKRVEQMVRQRTQELSATNVQLEQDRRRITAQYAATQALSEAESLRQAAPQILRQFCGALEWEAGALWSLDRAANVLRCTEFWSSLGPRAGRFEAMIRKTALTQGLGLPGRVWSSGKPAWIPDVAYDGNFPCAGEAQGAGLRAACAFPVRLGTEIVGAVEFFNDRIEQPDERLLGMMEAVGNQIGQFIGRKRLEGLKEEFVSTVSHEMRTPLSITREGVSLVLDRITGEINEEQERILSTARGNIDRLARIINDLLDISKLESGRVSLERQRCDLNLVLQQTAETFGSRASEKGLRIRVQPAAAPVIEVYADRDKVTEILTNLIDNALKFTQSGEILLSAAVDGDWVECSVADTGVGISTEDLPRVFGKFEQFGRLPGAGARGTGLGLAIVKHLVELHQGAIRVESQPGKGTRFLFTLPVYSPRGVLQGLVEDKRREAAVKGARLSLLGIAVSPADDDSLLKELERLLQKRACRRGDFVVRTPRGFALVLADCDRESALRIQNRCERVLKAVLELRFGKAATVVCGVVTFPEEAQSGPEMLLLLERKCSPSLQEESPQRMAG